MGLKNDFRNFDHWHGEDICQVWMYMVHLWVIMTHQCSLFHRHKLGMPQTQRLQRCRLQGLTWLQKPNRTVQYKASAIQEVHNQKAKPNLFIDLEYTHHTRMDQLGRKFCVKTSDDYLFSFVLGVRFKGLGKVKGVLSICFTVSLFFLRSLDIFALSQALGPAGVLLTRGEDGNAILIRRLQLWTSRE